MESVLSILTSALILLGVGMFGAPTFGKGFGRVIVVLGAVGLVAAALQMVDPPSVIGVGTYFACLISYLVLGWKIYSLSKAP